jgi:hypothetical protein
MARETDAGRDKGRGRGPQGRGRGRFSARGGIGMQLQSTINPVNHPVPTNIPTTTGAEPVNQAPIPGADPVNVSTSIDSFMEISLVRRALETAQIQTDADVEVAGMNDNDDDDADEAFWTDLSPHDKRAAWGVASVSYQDPPGNTVPSSSTPSSTTIVASTANLFIQDAFYSAPWNRQSFIFGLLHGYLKLPDDFHQALCDILHISDTNTFLEFFKANPSSFPPRLPLQAVTQYHDHICQAWSITK